jgi:hypothetical protein
MLSTLRWTVAQLNNGLQNTDSTDMFFF